MTDINHLTVQLYHCDRHITITRTRLYTNLVTCDRLHALTLIAYLQLCHLSATCIHVFIICITVQLSIVLFSLSICSCSYYYICTWFLLHELVPLYTHTHYGCVLTTLSLHVQLLDGCSNVQGSTRLFVLRGTGRSFFYFWYFTSLYSVISWFCIYCFHLPCSCHHLPAILRIVIICIIAVFIDHYASDL